MVARARVRFRGKRAVVQYRLEVVALVPKRSRIGLPYIGRERREEWVDWKTYREWTA